MSANIRRTTPALAGLRFEMDGRAGGASDFGRAVGRVVVAHVDRRVRQRRPEAANDLRHGQRFVVAGNQNGDAWLLQGDVEHFSLSRTGVRLSTDMI
jgi:hypothetical protein